MPGVCVLVNGWHGDGWGRFHWVITGAEPQQAKIQIYKRYDGKYEHVRHTVPLSRIESEPFVVTVAE